MLPACSRYVPCALYVLSLYTVMWSGRSERPAARAAAAVRAARSGPLVTAIRCHTIPNIGSLYIVMSPPTHPSPCIHAYIHV